MLDRRMRLNADVFYMDYKDLQVTQTNAACLCNITDNAASAEIKGVEAEFTVRGDRASCDCRSPARTSMPRTRTSSSRRSTRAPACALDSSGNRLQRTPETQVDAAASTTRWRSVSWARRSTSA